MTKRVREGGRSERVGGKGNKDEREKNGEFILLGRTLCLHYLLNEELREGLSRTE